MKTKENGLESTVHGLRNLFVKNFRSISLTYLLSVLEEFFNLLYPFATGQAINGLLSQNSYLWLGVFIATWLCHTATGVMRQRYDTMIFTKIYSQLAADMVETQRRQGVSSSQILARSGLTRELVDFFEHDIPVVIGALFGFVGSLVMLFCYDWQIGFACMAALVPLWIISSRYLRKAKTLNQKLNDQLEKEAEILGTGDLSAVVNHYQQVGHWRVQLSNAEASNWGIFESVLILVTSFVIVRAAAVCAVEEAGTVYATIAYLWSYCASLACVPSLAKRMSRLKDISDRIATAKLP